MAIGAASPTPANPHHFNEILAEISMENLPRLRLTRVQKEHSPLASIFLAVLLDLVLRMSM